MTWGLREEHGRECGTCLPSAGPGREPGTGRRALPSNRDGTVRAGVNGKARGREHGLGGPPWAALSPGRRRQLAGAGKVLEEVPPCVSLSSSSSTGAMWEEQPPPHQDPPSETGWEEGAEQLH